MQLLRITRLLSFRPVIRRRKHGKHIAVLRSEDAKIQAERQARRARAMAHKQTPPSARATITTRLQPVPVLVPVPAEIPGPQNTNGTRVSPPRLTIPTDQGKQTIAKVVQQTRGAYANDFSSRRLQEYSRPNM